MNNQLLELLLTALVNILVDFETHIKLGEDGEIIITFRRIKLKAVTVHFYVEGEEITNMIIKDNEQFTATVAFKDAKGFDAAVDGIPVWTGPADGSAIVTPALDGMSALIAGALPGSGQVSVQADADLGAGTTTITGALDLQVTPGDAATAVISAGPVSVQ